MNRREFGQDAFNNDQFLAGGITLLISGFIGFVGNTFVLIITYRILRYRKSIPTMLILFLAWIDFITFPLIYPQSLIKYFFGVYVGDYIACDYQGTVITLLYGVSILLVLIMSIDRLLALYKPFCYEQHISYDKEKVKVTAIGVGAAGLMIALLPAFGVGRNVLHFPGTFCLFEWGAKTVDGIALLYIYMTLLSIAILAIVFCNFTVVVLAWRLMRRLNMDSTLGDKEVANTHKKAKHSTRGDMEMQFAKLSCMAAIAIVGCWSLFLIRLTMIQAGYPFDAFIDFTAVRLASLHSVVNPWFYPLLRRKYREGFWYLITWVGHVATFTLINKPTNTLDDIVGGTPRTKRSKKIQKVTEDRRRSSSQRFVSTSTLATSLATESKSTDNK